MAWTSIALTLVTQGSGSVDMGRPLPGAHETEFVAATVWDPTRSRAVLTGAIDDVLAHALPTLTHGARHTLAAGIARNIERDTADTLRRDPYLTYMGLYVYLQPGASRVPDRRLVRRRLLSARARLREDRDRSPRERRTRRPSSPTTACGSPSIRPAGTRRSERPAEADDE
jgi:hypothetical protein